VLLTTLAPLLVAVVIAGRLGAGFLIGRAIDAKRWRTTLVLAHVAGGRSTVQALALNHLGLRRLRRNDVAGAGRLYEHALALAGRGEREVLGHPAVARALPDKARNVWRVLEAWSLVNLGNCLISEHRHAAARDALTRALGILEATGAGSGDLATATAFNLARLAMQQRDMPGALEWNRRARDTARLETAAGLTCLVEIQAARLAIARGRMEEARSLLERARLHAADTGRSDSAAEASAVLGLVAYLNGSPQVGVELALEGAEAMHRDRKHVEAVHWLRLFAREAAKRADAATARLLEERAAALARAHR
jgi:tetratricopeptide (TPR) repeat protein